MSVYATLPNPKAQRRFVPVDFTVTDWASIQPFYETLLARPLHSAQELEDWLLQSSELAAVVDEDAAWRYIRKSCDTTDETLRAHFMDYVQHMLPNIEKYSNALRQKYYDCPHRTALDPQAYGLFNRRVERDLELFREENTILEGEATEIAQEYGQTMAAMTVEVDGQEVTLQKAGLKLYETDRALREATWRKIAARRLQDADKINGIFDRLVAKRTQIARNAGFDTYTQYKFQALGRFGYTQADVHAFHQAIETVARPLYLEIMEQRRQELGYDTLKPWDLSVDTKGEPPLKPFETPEELAEKSIALFARMNPDIEAMLRTMHRHGFLDLGSRKGKEPGGYNYGLMETGVPFIFMNAVGTHNDLRTLVHEMGHAVHTHLIREQPLTAYRELTSEIAELASMSMELMSMDYWDTFYTHPNDLRRARYDQIIHTVDVLPWVATVDAFQEWVYDHPTHSHMERNAKWVEIFRRFHGDVPDYTGLEQVLNSLWHRQLHIFDVPFYYIEYGIAQIGALQVWQNYLTNPTDTLNRYFAALRLGYSRTIAEMYETAGIRFDFSTGRMQSIFQFVRQQLQQLQ
jgi:oligoendopeptidase F